MAGTKNCNTLGAVRGVSFKEDAPGFGGQRVGAPRSEWSALGGIRPIGVMIMNGDHLIEV